MSNTMINKVARALAEASEEDFDDISKAKYIGDAKAAINAMREPTEEMLSVDFKNDYIIGEGNHDKLRKLIIFQSMIDVALKD